MPALQGEGVDLWLINLDEVWADQPSIAQVLNPEELQRADRFRFAHLRQRFIAGRAVLRYLLADYLAIAPEQVPITYQPYGKPVLASSQELSNLQFNLSHCQAWALYGFSPDCPIGVDLEEIRPIPDLDRLTHQVFTVPERDLLQAQLPPDRDRVFFRLWTCKEACLKVTGAGIQDLQRITVPLTMPLADRDGITVTSTQPPIVVRELEPIPGYVGAIARPHSLPDLRFKTDWIPSQRP